MPTIEGCKFIYVAENGRTMVFITTEPTKEKAGAYFKTKYGNAQIGSLELVADRHHAWSSRSSSSRSRCVIASRRSESYRPPRTKATAIKVRIIS
jgi:hypothetical protein